MEEAEEIITELEVPPLTEADQLAINALYAWLYQRGLKALAEQGEDVCAAP